MLAAVAAAAKGKRKRANNGGAVRGATLDYQQARRNNRDIFFEDKKFKDKAKKVLDEHASTEAAIARAIAYFGPEELERKFASFRALRASQVFRKPRRSWWTDTPLNSAIAVSSLDRFSACTISRIISNCRSCFADIGIITPAVDDTCGPLQPRRRAIRKAGY